MNISVITYHRNVKSVKRQVPLLQAGTADPIMDIIHQEAVGNVENEYYVLYIQHDYHIR
jgi:hypothetical protein